MNNLIVKRGVEVTEFKTKGGRRRFGYQGAGRWNNEAIYQVMLLSKPNKWFSVEELARVAFLSASLANQKKTRLRLSKLREYLFETHGRVLIKEYERRVDDIRMLGEMRKQQLKGRNIIARVKMATFEDKPLAESELNALFSRNEITRDQLERMQDSLKMLEGPKS